MKKKVGLFFCLFLVSNLSVMHGAFKASSIRLPAILTSGKRYMSMSEITVKKPCCKIMSSKICARSECAAEFRELMSTQGYIKTDIDILIAVSGADNWTTLDLATQYKINEQHQVKLAKKICVLHKSCILGN